MPPGPVPVLAVINCRIGSLESIERRRSISNRINCRIGSLEKEGDTIRLECDINCRIGSLEKLQKAGETLLRH